MNQIILTLLKVPVVKVNSTPVYDQIRPEGGWLPQSDVTEVEQYDLLKQGFQAQEKNRRGDVMDSPYESWVTRALGAVSEEAEQARSMQYGQVPAFYRELAARIDSNRDGNVTAEEIRQALSIRDPLVRRVVNRLVVKHHSEWFGGRTTGAWERFYKDLDPLEVKFCQKWQADQEWMSRVPPFDKGEAIWHMHPVVFLGAINNDDEMDLKWLIVPKGQLTFDAEGNDLEHSPWFSRKIHWPGGISGVTIGRGYDLGQQSNAENDLKEAGIDEPLKSWLVGSSGLSSTAANNRLNSASNEVRTYNITRKEQYDLFMISYQRLEDDVKRINQKPDTIRSYHPNPSATAEQPWADIPDKIKEILADLRYRGDYTPGIRTHIQRFAYSGDIDGFGRILSDKSYWGNVPQDRFDRRSRYYEN